MLKQIHRVPIMRRFLPRVKSNASTARYHLTCPKGGSGVVSVMFQVPILGLLISHLMYHREGQLFCDPQTYKMGS